MKVKIQTKDFYTKFEELWAKWGKPDDFIELEAEVVEEPRPALVRAYKHFMAQGEVEYRIFTEAIDELVSNVRPSPTEGNEWWECKDGCMHRVDFKTCLCICHRPTKKKIERLAIGATDPVLLKLKINELVDDRNERSG